MCEQLGECGVVESCLVNPSKERLVWTALPVPFKSRVESGLLIISSRATSSVSSKTVCVVVDDVSLMMEVLRQRVSHVALQFCSVEVRGVCWSLHHILCRTGLRGGSILGRKKRPLGFKSVATALEPTHSPTHWIPGPFPLG